MLRKKQKNNHKKNTKLCIFIIGSLLVLPINYESASINLIKEAKQLTQKIHEPVNDQKPTLPSFQTEKIERNIEITGVTIFWTTVTMLGCSMLTMILIGYLKNQPTNKQCLMNCMYQDAIKINFAIVLFWSGLSVTCKWFGNGSYFDIRPAIYIALANQTLSLFLHAYLNAIGFLRLYTMKYKSLDPATEWIGDDDNKALRKFRTITSLLVIIAITTMFATDTNPPIFYHLHGKNGHVKHLPIGSCVVLGLQILLCSACAFLHFAAKVYLKLEETKLFQRHTQGGMYKFTSIDTEFPLLERFIVPILPYLTSTLVLILGLVLLYSTHITLEKGNFWFLASLFITVEGLLLPGWIVFRSANIRLYAKRQLGQTWLGSLMFCTYIKLLRIIKRRGRNVIRPFN